MSAIFKMHDSIILYIQKVMAKYKLQKLGLHKPK